MKITRKLIFAIIVAFITVGIAGACQAASNVMNVEQAMNEPDGTNVSVEGYIVGVPVRVDHVEQKDFTSNYALALADDPAETQISKMIFIKLDSEYRAEYGLVNHPENMGDFIEVDGTRDPYFSHEGVENVTSIITKSTSGGGGSGSGGPNGYYDSVEGKSGQALKDGLNDIIDAHTEISYDDVWGALRMTDEDPANANNVLLLYSGRSQSKYENGGDVDDWNREHVWAKSHGDFGNAMGPGTDLHHLRPTDVTVNSSRSNLDFDNGGSSHHEAPGTFYDSDSWEPRDEVKGDVARMIFYMAVRYEGERSGEPDLVVADYVGTSGPKLGKLSTLKQWHDQDPVSDFEQNRNEIIYNDYQNNRNPFIDHPEYVDLIW
ncbi:endonuclease [Halobacillus yeomjeoni]|uniref:Endonuclease n=1 Tax=Halobacillus yeomjeoni TaxID=311194 RepID=A0A931HWP8_9BACI|nr:endonuclease [Halobacillus yeomjeoni]MBH0231257.1 endonuclease [Halobacillus yeomjeoni]